MIPPVKVIALGSDEWSRPCLRNVANGNVYADINLGEGTPDWHLLTDEGEPWSRLRKDIVFEIVEPDPLVCECGHHKDDHYDRKYNCNDQDGCDCRSFEVTV